MKISLKRGDLKSREDSVFVDVTHPNSVTARFRASTYFSDWTHAARDIATDAPPVEAEPTEQEQEPCRAKLCLNKNGVFTAVSRHCQIRSGCILRKASWNAKDREWIRCAGDAVCVVVGAASFLAWFVLG